MPLVITINLDSGPYTRGLAEKVRGTFSSHGLLCGYEGAKNAVRHPWLPQEHGLHNRFINSINYFPCKSYILLK